MHAFSRSQNVHRRVFKSLLKSQLTLSLGTRLTYTYKVSFLQQLHVCSAAIKVSKPTFSNFFLSNIMENKDQTINKDCEKKLQCEGGLFRWSTTCCQSHPKSKPYSKAEGNFADKCAPEPSHSSRILQSLRPVPRTVAFVWLCETTLSHHPLFPSGMLEMSSPNTCKLY